MHKFNEMLIENYKEIITIMCRMTVSEDKLEELKKHFEKDIDSVRRYDWIKNVEQLIHILERRAVISCSEISKLYFIAEKIGHNNRLGSLLILQSKYLSKYEYERPNLLKITLLTDFKPTLPESVKKFISMSLKNSWQEFARSLNSNGKCLLKEGTIDKINENNNEKEEKARQVLEAFLNEASINRVMNANNILFTALEKVKRRDVRERVEELLTENRLSNINIIGAEEKKIDNNNFNINNLSY